MHYYNASKFTKELRTLLVQGGYNPAHRAATTAASQGFPH